nr:cupredoxin domain-containing protein [Ktedonobacterales bacterium]
MKWKIVVSVLCLLAVTACGTIKLSNANQHAVTITIHDNYFSPNAITVPPRQPVKITLINMGVNVHIVEIKGLTPEAPLQPGQSASFTVTPQARAYQIYDEIY